MMKNMNEKSDIYYPTCRFCGSTELPSGEYDSQEQADEAATIRCECCNAREYQTALKAKKEREKNISNLRRRLDDFSDYCKPRGAELSDELHTTLFNAGVAVLDDVVQNVTFKFLKIKASISKNGKGALVMAFTYSDSEKVEV